MHPAFWLSSKKENELGTDTECNAMRKGRLSSRGRVPSQLLKKAKRRGTQRRK